MPTPTPFARISDIADFKLESLTVSLGTTVTWVNRDFLPHTTTSGVPDRSDGNWDSPILITDEEFSFTFDRAGVFPYWCRVHPFMNGMITVAG